LIHLPNRLRTVAYTTRPVDEPVCDSRTPPGPTRATPTSTSTFVPVGSTEQHGPHAPLGTDTLNAVAVAEAGAAAYEAVETESSADVVVTPPIPVGVEEHRAFDGTMWISPDTFRAYVRRRPNRCHTTGIDRVVFVNGHGGNVEALAEVARRFSGGSRGTTVTTVTRSRSPGRGGRRSARTATWATPARWRRRCCCATTNPDLVREDRIEAARGGGGRPLG